MKKTTKICLGSLAVLLSASATCIYATNNKIEFTDSVIAKQSGAVSTTSRESSDAEPEKDETVYALLDANGNTNKIIVSDWLKNAKALDTIYDISNLSDIVNVKGDETFSTDKNQVEWAANGADIYYQGTSEKALPIQMKVTYTLDGTEITPEELKGKSGNVSIRFDYKNTDKRTVETASGDNIDVYMPYMLATTTVLNTDKFINIEVSNGKIVSDGNKAVVFGTAFPGLQESLDLKKDDLDIPDYFEITADVTDFELSTTATVAINDVFSLLNLDSIDNIDDLNDSLVKLSDASNDLVKGTVDLYDGVCKLYDGAGTLSDGIAKLDTGAATLETGAGKLADGTKQLSTGVNTLYTNVKKFNSGLTTAKTGASSIASGCTDLSSAAKQFTTGTTTISTGLSSLATGMETASTGLSQTIAANKQVLAGLEAIYKENKSQDIYTMIATLKKTIETQEQISASLQDGNNGLKDGVTSLQGGVSKLADGAKSFETGIGTLSTGASSLSKGVSDLSAAGTKLETGTKDLYNASVKINTGASDLAAGSKTLASGIASLKTGSSDLLKGIGDLKTGSKDLKEGMNEFNETGIQKLVNTFDGDLKKLIDRLDVLKELAEKNETYSGVSDDMDGNVKFIYTTEEIE
ncbi:YhgE/Pip domain-containing protein [Anaeromicropila populeti]|uniref:Putative membrane protein n=1 Tax=Anaeromicropila populeti TaxID=37658 RepID=A0A1I6J1H9_9FIRM|nr:hypothetical protein [Anaeromicropila populeti]SFR72862.1 putative membrane protein [Anaeromicropila populeti]